MLSADTIERALARLRQRLDSDPALQAELGIARGEFFPSALAQVGPEAERRLLEWFLLERPSTALGGVPVVVLEAELDGPEVVSALRDSSVGVFEVSSVAAQDGLWLIDLLHGGERPVAEEVAVEGLAPGDLMVGRLYPVGGGVARLSPAVSCFRNRELAQALRADLEQIRAARRGVIRVGQAELERLFHPVVQAAPTASLSEARRQAATGLRALGLQEPASTALIEQVHQAVSRARPGGVTEILNRLAFETEVDLEGARRVLVDLWDAERAATLAVAPTVVTAEDSDVGAALAAFDEGRAAGKDLESCFQQLERDLGLEPEAQDEDGEGVPDFPGVVGAMIEEFLWDVAREQGQAQAEVHAVLRCLGTYAADLGVFEELGRAHLVDFAGRWLLDESGLRDPADIARVLDALGAFCRWSEERHAHPLWTPLEAVWGDLVGAIPRLVRLREQLSASERGSGPYEVLRVETESVLVVGDGREWVVPLTREQAAHLRSGDLVRLSVAGETPRLATGYPKELASVLE